MDLQAYLGLGNSPAGDTPPVTKEQPLPLGSASRSGGAKKGWQHGEQQQQQQGQALTPGRRRLFEGGAPSLGGSSSSSLSSSIPMSPSPSFKSASKAAASASAARRRAAGLTGSGGGSSSKNKQPQQPKEGGKASPRRRLQEEEDEDGENRTPNVQPARQQQLPLQGKKATTPVRSSPLAAGVREASPAPSVATTFYLSPSDSDSDGDADGEEALLAAGVVGGGETGGRPAVFFFPEDDEEVMAAARAATATAVETEKEEQEQPGSPSEHEQQYQQQQQQHVLPPHTPQTSRKPLPSNPPPTPASPLGPLTPDSAMAAPQSVDRLLRRASAVRTPELAGPVKVQSWISERVLSAVKKFVFDGTSGARVEREETEDARDTSSLAVFEGDGESIVEDCGPEHWPMVAGGNGGSSQQTPARGPLLDVSELASPRMLQEEEAAAAAATAVAFSKKDTGTQCTPASSVPPVTTRSIERSDVFRQDALAYGGYPAARLPSPPVASPITMRPRSSSLLPAAAAAAAASSAHSLAPPQTVPLSFSASPSSPLPRQQQQHHHQQHHQQQQQQQHQAFPSNSTPAAALFSPPPRALAQTRKPAPCGPPPQEPGRAKPALRAWGAGSACSVHRPELRDGDLAPGAAEEEEAVLRRMRAAAGGAWVRGAAAPVSSSPLTPWTAERRPPAKAAAGGGPLLRVLAAAAAEGGVGDGDLTFSSEACSSFTEAPVVPAAAAAAAAAAATAALPAATRLPHLYSPPLKARRTVTRRPTSGGSSNTNTSHLRPGAAAASAALSSSLSASMPAAAMATGLGGSRLGQRKGLSRSMGAPPSVSREQQHHHHGPAHHNDEAEEEAEEEADDDDDDDDERSLSAAFLPTTTTTTTTSTSSAPSSSSASSSFACSAPVTWTGVRVGAAASRELVLRNCQQGNGGVGSGSAVTATIAPAGPTAAFVVEGAGKAVVSAAAAAAAATAAAAAAAGGGGGALRVVVTFRPRAPGMHRATLALALSGGAQPGQRRVYEVQLAGFAAPADGRQHSQRQREEEDKDDGEAFAFSGASMSAAAAAPSLPPAGAGAGVFFAAPVLDFGRCRVGSVCIEKIQLSNPLHAPQVVLIQKPVDLPFILLHKRIPLKPRAFVRLPVRFVPVGPGPFAFTLQATVHPVDGQGQAAAAPYRITLQLRGEGYE